MRRRLVILSVATTAIVVIAFTLPLALLVRDLALDRATAPAQLRAQSLAPVAALADRATLEAAINATDRAGSGVVRVVSPDGTRVGPEPFPDVPFAAADVVVLPDGGRVAVVPVIAPAGTGAVLVSIPAEALRQGVAAAWTILGALGLLLVGIAAVLTDRMARSTTVALEAVESTARELIDGNLEARADVTDPPEVERIALALDDLARRTSGLLVAERERAADLSHALRTPLTALRLDVEALPAGPERDAVQVDIGALESALDRAIVQARQPLADSTDRRSDLAAVCRERTRWWRPLADDEGRSFVASVPSSPCWVPVAPSRLAEAVDALIGNVFSHTDPGVGLAVSLDGDGTSWTVQVQDEGPGFPPGVDVLARGVSGAGSSGLGLAIVAETAEAAGGSVTVTTGRGVVRMMLPSVPGPR